MWRDEIKLNNRNTALGNKHRINCNNDEDQVKYKVLHWSSSTQLSLVKKVELSMGSDGMSRLGFSVISKSIFPSHVTANLLPLPQ